MSFGSSQFRSVLSSLENIVSGTNFESAVSESINQIGLLFNGLGIIHPNAVNIYETLEHVVVEIQVPGLDRSQLNLWIEGQNLMFSCKKSKHSDQAKYYQTEFGNEDYTRSILLPRNADVSKLQANILRGILTVRFSKLPENEKIEIVIE